MGKSKTGGGRGSSISLPSSWLTSLKRAFISSPTKRITTARPDNPPQDNGKGKRTIRTTTTTKTAEDVTRPGPDAISVALATTIAAEAAVANAKAALEAIPIACRRLIPSLVDHRAAVIIQTAFRGHLARKALRALKGLVCLQALIRGRNVRKRAETTLRCIQALVRVQAQLSDQQRSQLSHGCNIMCRNHGDGCIKEYGNGKPQDEYCEKEICLASAFSQQIWSRDEDSADQWMKRKLRDSPRRTSFDQRDSFKTIEIDTYGPYTSSDVPTPHPKRLPSQANSSSPRFPRNRPDISIGSVPSYMCPTESTRARFRSQSNPRPRASTPQREMMMVPPRKKLFFPEF